MSHPHQVTDPRLTHQIIFRVTDDDFHRLESLAAKSGLGVNELARQLTRRGGRRLVIQVARRHDPAFITQLQRIGLNLNQLVKRAHILGGVSPRVDLLCEQIEGLVQDATAERLDA